MVFFLECLLIVDAVLLVALVLLHAAKGDGFGAMGGDGKLFVPTRGLEDGLNRLTMGVAAMFFILTLLLSAMS